MSLLILCIVVLVVCALLCWAVQNLPLKAPFGAIIQALICVVGALVIIQRAGLLSG